MEEKRLKVLVFFIIIAGLTLNFGLPLLANEFAKLDAGGQRIVNIFQRLGYWIILIKCIIDLIKAGLNGDLHSVGRIIMLYLLMYGALFFVPWALRLVEGIFV